METVDSSVQYRTVKYIIKKPNLSLISKSYIAVCKCNSVFVGRFLTLISCYGSTNLAYDKSQFYNVGYGASASGTQGFR